MNKEIESLFAQIEVDIEDKPRMPKNYIENQLGQCIGKVIANSFDKSLLNYTVENHEFLPREIHKIRINLISDKELMRLKEIESLYTLHHGVYRTE